MHVNITAGYGATGVYLINPSVIRDANFASNLLTNSEDAQFSNVVTVTETPTTVFCHSKRLGRLLLGLVHLATLCQPTGMMIGWLTVQKSVIK